MFSSSISIDDITILHTSGWSPRLSDVALINLYLYSSFSWPHVHIPWIYGLITDTVQFVKPEFYGDRTVYYRNGVKGDGSRAWASFSKEEGLIGRFLGEFKYSIQPKSYIACIDMLKVARYLGDKYIIQAPANINFGKNIKSVGYQDSALGHLSSKSATESIRKEKEVILILCDDWYKDITMLNK